MTEKMKAALEQCLEQLYAPNANCSCHISPPCKDCVDYAGIRDAIRDAKDSLSQQPASEIPKSEIEDMAFAYCPSGKIGELMEFAEALLAKQPDCESLRVENEQLEETELMLRGLIGEAEDMLIRVISERDAAIEREHWIHDNSKNSCRRTRIYCVVLCSS
jgi:hypothetical protein